ncbi:MAG: hypothetical protein N3E40_05290 [Dehalococcoidia bacterium]|nr:hypothetical protein [Dehalococcoidia bacterium]
MPLLWWSSESSRDIPPWAYYYLVTRLGVPHEVLTGLKCFEHRDFMDGMLTNFIRIYHPEEARRAGIDDFISLDRFPELILWEGWYNQETGEIFLEEKAGRKL